MKTMKALVVMALVLFMAAPAFAEIKLNGYYRLQGTWAEVDDADGDDTEAITQRVRLRMDKSLNENVGLVYFIESDLDWGNNGDVGVDDKNIETKNAYLYVNGDKFGAKLGAQGYTDIFNGLIISEDIMAATAKFDLGAADLNLMYGKLDEGSVDVEDDTDIYGAYVAVPATDALKVSAGVWVVDAEEKGAETDTCLVADADGGCTDVDDAVIAFGDLYNSASLVPESTTVVYGARVDFAASEMLDLSAFALFQDLEDGSSSAFAANADIKLANGKIMLEGLLVEDADGDADDTFVQVSPFYYNGTPFMYIKRDIAATNNGYNEGKYRTFANGMKMLSGYGQFNFAGIYAGAGVAWADTYEDEIGTEFVAKVGKKFFGNVDCSIRAAQFDAGESDVSDETKVIGMINVGF